MLLDEFLALTASMTLEKSPLTWYQVLLQISAEKEGFIFAHPIQIILSVSFPHNSN